MSWIKEIIAYYKDNPQGYWFKRRLYGWGWMPVKWQGWLVKEKNRAGSGGYQININEKEKGTCKFFQG